MATKNHTRSLNQQERAFWKEAFLQAPFGFWNSPNEPMLVDRIKYRADFADAAVAEYRKRITWRLP